MRSRKIALAVALALAACEGGDEDKGGGDGGGGSGGKPSIVVEVDATVAPDRELPVPDGGVARPLAAAEDASGNRVEFVENEVVVVETTPGQAEQFAGKHGGTVVERVELDETTNVVLVRVTAPAGDPARLPSMIATADHAAQGELRISSDAAARLLAAVGEAGVDDGLTIMPNPVFTSSGVQDRTTADAATGEDGWNPDMTQLPGFRRGDAQDIGVAEAWRMLAVSGRTANRVRVAILDQGFHHDADIDGALMIPADRWDKPGTIPCSGGTACPWHGTGVAQIAGGLIDNGHGAAGTGGQVVDLVLAERFGQDFFEIVRFLVHTLPRTFAAAPRVVNMSFGSDIPAGWYALTFGALDAAFGGIRTLSGTLLLAAAGNAGADVDREDCFLGICWEGAVHVPCENAGVTCIGGVSYDSIYKDAGSNWGSRRDASSVELFAPYWNWVGEDPEVGSASPDARLIAGTSGATPFVAGVAAMVWAADPSLRVDDVERILLDTAHPSGTAALRLVDARAAVKKALGGNAPPYLTIVTPADGSSFDRGATSVPFLATVEDEEGGVTVKWTSSLDGELSTAASFSTQRLSAGAHVVTVTATDGPWSISRTVNVTIRAPLPRVQITQPIAGPYYATVPVSFAGTAYDPGELMNVPAGQVSWRIGSATAAPFATGLDTSYTFASAGTYTVFLVAQGAGGTASDSTTLVVEPAPVNRPPVVTITNPATATFDAGYPATNDAMGYYYAITLQGTAADPESGALTGTWSKRRHKSGASFEDLGSGNSKAVKLYVDGGQASTTWEVRFQASDGTNTATDTVVITVQQLI